MTIPTVDWQAEWIGSDVEGGRTVCPPVPYLRKEFPVREGLKEASLAITALGLYECEINGRTVGDHVLAPGWSVYLKRVAYQVYDVAGHLQPGDNAIGVMLADGWYCGYLGMLNRQNYGDRPEMLCRLELVYEDGTREIVGSDASWITSIGPLLQADLLMGEIYDQRHELGAWSEAGYDASRWAPVVIGAGRDLAVEDTEIPPVRRIDTLRPVEELSAGPNPRKMVRVFDFGQNFTGRVRFHFEGRPGLHLRFRHAEVLDADGRLYTENLRRAKATDEYSCVREGRVTWEPRFTFHGFRYVSVEGLAKDAKCAVEGIVLHNDMPVTGTFCCSHRLLNQLEHNILWGQKGNFLEVPTDCPQRDERLGWTGDAQVFIRTAAFHMNVQGFFHKWLQDMRDEQGPSGAIPPVAPEPRRARPDLLDDEALAEMRSRDGGPAWADAAIISPWTLYLCYGDTQVLEDHYTCMTGYMDHLAENKVKDGIRCHPDKDAWGGFGDWLALDGSGRTDGGTPKDLIGTAFYANNADLLARIAAVLGKREDAEKYRALHGSIRDAFRHRFITPNGLMASGTQTSYVLALHFGLMPEEARAEAVTQLVRSIERNGMHLATGFVGTPYLLDVLDDAGRLDVAYQLLEQETFPSWLFPVKNGATTIWERWDGWTPEKGFQDPGMNSFNHYAYGCVGTWMVRSVAGLDLDPAEPGYKHTIFRPRPGGSITWAEAALDTAHGRHAIRWEIEDDTLLVKLDVPPGVSATFLPPPGWEGVEQALTEGHHELALARAS